MYKEVIKWLNNQSIHISKNYLRLRLETHPEYPSLTAVQDTLAELEIVSNAYETSKEELIKNGKPFLAHFNLGDGHILSFNNLTEAESKVKDFDKQWSGVVMLADKKDNYGNTEHNSLLKKEKINQFFGLAAMSILFISFLELAAWNNSLPGILLLLSNIAGLYFSWLIVQKEFGISNSISDKICSMAKHSRCESVLFSKAAKLLSWLTWGDVGIIYFSASLLFIAATLFTASSLQLYYYISLTGLLFPLYSLYYQWKVVKQWCMLCNAVLAALFLDALISFSFINTSLVLNKELLVEISACILGTALVLSCWLLLKFVFQKSIRSLDNEIKALRLKRNPEIFNALLQKEIANPVNLPEKDEAIQFGNPFAPYQIVIACNPYCGPCAKAHQGIEELYEKNPDSFSVSIRFALDENNDEDKRVQTVKAIIKAARKQPFEAVKDWYNLFDLEKFNALYKVNGLDVNGYTERHIQWSKEVGINATPTFFINGKKLPGLYNWKEFLDTIKTQLIN